MATVALAVQKLAFNATPDRVGSSALGFLSTGATAARASSAGPNFTVEAGDLSNLVIAAHLASTANMIISVTASTDGFTSQGLGAFTYTTTAAKSSADILLGPFESARFKSVSTGETLRFTVKTTTGGTLKGTDVAAIQFVPST